MKIKKKFTILILGLFALSSCTSFSEVGKVMRNEKVKTTDEFLVKKKEPLTLPPDFSELPVPNSKKDSKKEKKINNIFDNAEIEKVDNKKASSTENSIINQIKK
jgi:hypothetical protein|tara:strand:- start:224 stop:535 length:312 start_codon:yes stop_codon:yes gene_type:complete